MDIWTIPDSFLSCFFSILIARWIFLFLKKQFFNFLHTLKVNYLLSSISILEITNIKECKDACLKIKAHCQDLSALGFDCEWVSVSGMQRPVALLQLATVHGLCCLFRLNILNCIPEELKDLLFDYKIIKLGISPLDDSKKLRHDYNVQVRSTLDLRFLYPNGGGLGAMAASEIGVILNKDWRIRCSNWEKPILTDAEKDYAAKDAFAAIEIFKKWLTTNNSFSTLYYYKKVFSIPTNVFRFLDRNFSQKNTNDVKEKTSEISSNLKNKEKNESYSTRKTPLYHNCFMHAPDGELLCSCDRRKAQWYVDRGLAEVLPCKPYSIRLLFEPEARPGDTREGRFYQDLKQNCCVVCGALDSYLKHNVVPKEYRKHFPNHMKDHQSHDIVLMCVSCHLVATEKNKTLRNALADHCNAPLTTSKVTSVRKLQKLRDSAKALLTSAEVIPEKRKSYLENNIKMYYKVDTLTPEMLKMALSTESIIKNEQYESHGFKVVKYFYSKDKEFGLVVLERLWREHFINTMNPQHLPLLWSVYHKNQ